MSNRGSPAFLLTNQETIGLPFKLHMQKSTMVNKTERQLVFDKYNGRCAYCGCILTKGWHVDHLKPIRRKKYKKGECRYPQRECIENYMPACASCNINKHAMKLEDFRQLVAGFMKHLNERNTQYKIAKRYGLVVEQEKPVIFYFEQHESKARSAEHCLGTYTKANESCGEEIVLCLTS